MGIHIRLGALLRQVPTAWLRHVELGRTLPSASSRRGVIAGRATSHATVLRNWLAAKARLSGVNDALDAGSRQRRIVGNQVAPEWADS